MTEGSYKIIIKKIENVLSTALMDSDPEGNKRITFEQFGRVLTLLGIFRVIYYNEEFEGKQAYILEEGGVGKYVIYMFY